METSTFADNWQKSLEDPVHSDVVFLVESKHKLKAHKVVLCSGTDFFCKIFGISNTQKVRISGLFLVYVIVLFWVTYVIFINMFENEVTKGETQCLHILYVH